MPALTVVPDRSPHRPPRPTTPVRADKAAVGYWNDYWRSGVSTLWTPSDYPVIARLALLQSSFFRSSANGDVAARLAVQLGKLESALFLTPASRRTHNIIIEADAPASLDDRRTKDEIAARLASRLTERPPMTTELPDVLKPDPESGRPRGAVRVTRAVADADVNLDALRDRYVTAVRAVDGDDGLNDEGRHARRAELRDEFFAARNDLASTKTEALAAVRAAANTAAMSGADVASRRQLIADAARFTDADEARRAAQLHIAGGDPVPARVIALAASGRTGDAWSSLAQELVEHDPVLSAASAVLDAVAAADSTRLDDVASLVNRSRWVGDPAAPPRALGARGVENMSAV